MSLSNALAAASSGLRITQAAVDVAAKNISNVDVPGYTRKSVVQDSVILAERTLGVRLEGYTREISQLVQRELRNEIGDLGTSDVLNTFYDRIDRLYGSPGSSNALDGLYNELVTSLTGLETTPESISSQTEVASDAAALASRINQIADGIQSFRTEAEQQIGQVIERINGLLGELETTSQRIVTQTNIGSQPVELLDQRDRVLDELSRYLDISIVQRDDGGVNVLTENGALLFDFDAVRLNFDGRDFLTADARWSADAAERGVGTITLSTGNGYQVDLIADGSISGGVLGGLLSLRDDILVEAQQQVDEFAAGLSRAFSDSPVAGTAATVGLQTGFDIDISTLQSGNPITLTYTDNVSGDSNVVSFIPVNEPSVLPLDNAATARTDDTVFGIDFSGGAAAIATQIATALGANFTVSNPAGDVIRILDDGAPDAVDVTAVDAIATATGLTDQGLGLPLFVDAGNTPRIFSGSFDRGGQLSGFSSRISVNSDIVDNPDSLVLYSTSPQTQSGDPTRPQALLDRLDTSRFEFSAETGLGGSNGYSSTISNFMQQIITFQGAAADNARQAHEAQDQVVTTLQEAYIRDTGVNVDVELAKLIELQNAFSANARVISVIDEMIDTLMRI